MDSRAEVRFRLSRAHSVGMKGLTYCVIATSLVSPFLQDIMRYPQEYTYVELVHYFL